MTTINGDNDSYDEIDKKLWKIWRSAAGKLHSNGNSPACIWVDGDVYYFRDGKPHRDGGLPAVIYADGRVEYWIDGVEQK